MKVLKFGGTSVGSVKSILSLKNIVENEAKSQPIIVVVSALGGITDKLLATSQLALKGDESWKDEFQAMVERHHKMIDTIITNPRQREDLFNKVDALLEQLEELTGHEVLYDIPSVEPLGPKGMIDVLVIAPCTGNTLAKLAHSIADGPVTMAAKSHLRNGRPVLVAVSTNRQRADHPFLHWDSTFPFLSNT